MAARVRIQLESGFLGQFDGIGRGRFLSTRLRSGGDGLLCDDVFGEGGV